MERTSCLLLVLSLAGAAPALAQDDVTIVFNADLRAFVCWVEGALEPADAGERSPVGCPYKRAREFRNNVHFYRGDPISVRIHGARLADAYAATITAEALVIPEIPVFGGMDSLPSLVAIEGASQLALPKGFSLASSDRRDVFNEQLFLAIDKASDADLKAFFDEYLLTPAFSKELMPLIDRLALETMARVEQRLSSGLLHSTGAALVSEVDTLHAEFTKLRASYCGAVGAPDAKDLARYFGAAQRLRQVIDRTKAWHAAIDSSAVIANMNTLAALFKLAADPAVTSALAVQVDASAGDPDAGVDGFLNLYEETFPLAQRSARIAAVAINAAGAAYEIAGLPSRLLAKVNEQAVGPASKPTADSLAKLKTNLTLLGAQLNSLRSAARRLRQAQDAVAKLEAFAASAVINSFNDRVVAVAATTIDAAEMANCVARNMPLPDGLSVVLSDSWYGSKQIKVALKKSTRLPLFDISTAAVSPLEPVGSAPGAGPQPPAASSNATANKPAPPPAPVGGGADTGTRSGQSASAASETAIGAMEFRVRERYHFQIGLGFMYSPWFEDRAYTVIKETATVNGAESTTHTFVSSRNRGYRFQPTVDLLFYAKARDFFPRIDRYDGDREHRGHKFGGLVGFSLTNPTKDFYFGGVYLPDTGIGVKAGLHVGYVDALPDGMEADVPFTRPVLTQQRVDYGAFVGVEMNAALFREVFGMILKKP